MSNMGARVARMFRNFNLENRTFREISKEKPHVAPRHKTGLPPSVSSSAATEITDSVHKKNDPLLALLRSVYVESTDPGPATEAPKPDAIQEEEERRALKFSLPGDLYGMVEITDVTKGKLSLVEALKALNSHKTQPKKWTPERIAQEYSLNLNDTEALLHFFVPFDVKIIPPKNANVKQIKDS